jgi:putative copper export protein
VPDLSDLLLVLIRAVALAALMTLFGTLLLDRVVAGPVLDAMQPAVAAPSRRRLLRLAWAAWAVSVPAVLLWSAMQTASLAETGSVRATLALLPHVLTHTQFGALIRLRLALLAATGLALAVPRGWSRVVATLGAGLAVAVQAGHLHALAMWSGPSPLLTVETLHVLAAGAWLGALPALLLVVRTSPVMIASTVARRFSPLGMACVFLLAMTAAAQGVVLVGSFPALVGTAHGITCLVKLAIFALLVALAARNRWRLVPQLLGGDPAAARWALAGSIARATVAGALVVLLAALLSALAPGIDALP